MGIATFSTAGDEERQEKERGKEKDNAPFAAQGKEAQRALRKRREEGHGKREKNLTQSSLRSEQGDHREEEKRREWALGDFEAAL
jgi:hypothetical protein